MKIKIQKNEITNALAKIQGIANRSTSLPIINMVLIEADNDNIILTATDLEIGFKGIYPATIEQTGSIAISAKKLYEITKNFPDDEVSIEEKKRNWISITGENVKYSMVGMLPEDFPEITFDNGEFFEFDSEDFQKTLKDVLSVPCFRGETRAHIAGVLFQRKESDMVMVSIDGGRLTKSTCFIEKPSDLPEHTILIQKIGLPEVLKFLEKQGTLAQVGVFHNNFIIKSENEIMTIRLLEGEFPGYEDIIPDGRENVCKINTKDFISTLKRMNIFSSEDYHGAVFEFSKSGLKITKTNPEIGESAETVSIDYAGENINLSLNIGYVLSAVSRIDEKDVEIYVTGKESVCLIKGSNEEYLALIMPLKD